MNNKILFQEKQKFIQWWLWLLLLAPLGFVLFKAISPLIEKSITTTGDLSLSNVLWFVIIISMLVLAFMFFINMVTIIDSEQIHIRHMLFLSKTFKWEDIESAEIVTYGFVGYGIRLSIKYGTVYNIKGNYGLFLKFNNGQKRLIGTQKPKELRKIMKQLACFND